MKNTVPTDPVKVSLLALPESTPAALYGLYEVLSSVGVSWAEATGDGEPAPLMEVKIVSEDGRNFASAIGTPIAPHAALHEVNRTDIVIVADLALVPERAADYSWPAMTDWVRAQYDQGATVCSVCTGTAFLAGTGLLDHCEATTHWATAEMVRAMRPEIDLKPERILVPAGPGHRIITSGGSSSWQDLTLYLIARYCGQAEAVRTAKVFLIGDHNDGQLPFTAVPPPRQHEDAVIADCQRWIAMSYHEANPVARMTARSGLGERTFKRRFQAATGFSPMDYVQALRIEEAKQTLETDDTPIEEIARSLGYEDPAFFRRLFKKRTGVTPGRYRQRYQSHIRF